MNTLETMSEPVVISEEKVAVPPPTDKVLDRIGYLSGLLFVGLFNFYGAKVPGPPSEFDSQILADFYRKNEINVVEGAYVATISFILFLIFATCLSNKARGADKGNSWLPNLMFGSGLMAVTMFVISQASLAAVALMAGRNAHPDVIRGMDEISHITVHLFAAPIGVFQLSTAACILLYSILPRWIAYPCLASGLTLLITTGSFNHTLLMHAVGIMGLIVFLLSVLIMSVTLLWKSR